MGNSVNFDNLEREFEQEFKSVSVAGATTGGSAYTTGVTQSSTTTIPIGTAGSYIQIEVAADAPQLYYYCTNHSGMGDSLLVFTRPDIINGIDDRLFGII